MKEASVVQKEEKRITIDGMASQAPVASSAESAAGSQWAHDSRVVYDQESETYIYTDDGGVTFEYDQAKSAWFPRFDEALVQAQQSVYDMPDDVGGGGGQHVSTADAHELAHDKNRPKRDNKDDVDADMTDADASIHQKPHRGKRQRSASDNRHPSSTTAQGSTDTSSDHANNKKRNNTSVYVTGLPPDTTVQELNTVFSKCGIILEDPATNTPRIKLYRNDKGDIKGDALVIFFKEESVQLAVDLLDESRLRDDDGSIIRVQKAVFQEKSNHDNSSNTGGRRSSNESSQKTPAPTGDAVADKKQTHKFKKKLETRLGWFEAEETKTNPRVRRTVILKHMFTLKELEDDPTLLLDLKQEVREECEKLGEITNVVLYDVEKDGIMMVRYKEQLSAEACVAKMDGRFFGGRRVEASIWNGKDKYHQSKLHMDSQDEQKRIEAYEAWLESQH